MKQPLVSLTLSPECTYTLASSAIDSADLSFAKDLKGPHISVSILDPLPGPPEENS